MLLAWINILQQRIIIPVGRIVFLFKRTTCIVFFAILKKKTFIHHKVIIFYCNQASKKKDTFYNYIKIHLQRSKDLISKTIQ